MTASSVEWVGQSTPRLRGAFGFSSGKFMSTGLRPAKSRIRDVVSRGRTNTSRYPSGARHLSRRDCTPFEFVGAGLVPARRPTQRAVFVAPGGHKGRPYAIPNFRLPVSASPPQERRRDVRAGDFFAHQSPELANFGSHLRGIASQCLEDQAGIIGQPARSERNAARKIDIGVHALMNAIGLVLGSAQNHIAEHVK